MVDFRTRMYISSHFSPAVTCLVTDTLLLTECCYR